jgi:hypothetical protein
MDKSIVVYPGLRLHCDKGRKLLLFESGGHCGFVDLKKGENLEAIDSWINGVDGSELIQDGNGKENA